MIITTQTVKGGIELSERNAAHGVTFKLTFEQAETLAYTLLNLVDKDILKGK